MGAKSAKACSGREAPAGRARSRRSPTWRRLPSCAPQALPRRASLACLNGASTRPDDDGEEAALVAVKIRLMRMGKKRQPTYRVVVADARSPRDGRFIEIIGTYAPRQEPSGVKIDTERASYWLGQGAQVTDRVRKLLAVSGAGAPAGERPSVG